MQLNIAPRADLASKKYNGFCEITTDSVNPIENVYNGFCDYLGASNLPIDPIRSRDYEHWFTTHPTHAIDLTFFFLNYALYQANVQHHTIFFSLSHTVDLPFW